MVARYSCSLLRSKFCSIAERDGRSILMGGFEGEFRLWGKGSFCSFEFLVQCLDGLHTDSISSGRVTCPRCSSLESRCADHGLVHTMMHPEPPSADGLCLRGNGHTHRVAPLPLGRYAPIEPSALEELREVSGSVIKERDGQPNL